MIQLLRTFSDVCEQRRISLEKLKWPFLNWWIVRFGVVDAFMETYFPWQSAEEKVPLLFSAENPCQCHGMLLSWWFIKSRKNRCRNSKRRAETKLVGLASDPRCSLRSCVVWEGWVKCSQLHGGSIVCLFSQVCCSLWGNTAMKPEHGVRDWPYITNVRSHQHHICRLASRPNWFIKYAERGWSLLFFSLQA